MIDLKWITTVPPLPPRKPDSHKGTYGRLLVVAGSRGMSGAAILSATSALRAGAGLVRVAVPVEQQPIVAAANPCYMTTALPQDNSGRIASAAIDSLLEHASWSNVVAIGPGLDQSDEITSIVAAMLTLSRRPLVIDADGLNALAKLPPATWQDRDQPTIVTPHPGEFGRMTGKSSAEIAHDRAGLAAGYALSRNVVVVLKGHHTIVTDGQRAYRNLTGNPGMATGGTGDVLTGIIASFVGMGLSPFDACVIGTWAHGRAGDLAAQAFCQSSLIATDLVSFLPQALREVGG